MKRFASLLALVLCVPGLLRAGVNTWSPTGPYGGEAYAVRYLPGSKGVVVSSQGHSLYRSVDDGDTWTQISNDRSGAYGIAVSSGSPNLVVSVGNSSLSLLRSDDGGATVGRSAALPVGSSGGTVAFSSDGQVLYYGSYGPRFFRSTDIGQSWTEFNNGFPSDPEQPRSIIQIVVDPGDANHVFVELLNAGYYSSTDGGAHWAKLDSAPCSNCYSIDVKNKKELLIGSESGVHRSADGGLSWTKTLDGFGFRVLYDPAVAGRAFAITGDGFFISNDDGGNWTRQSTTPPGFLYEFAADAGQPGHLMLATTRGMMRSVDAGLTWQRTQTGVYGGYFLGLKALANGAGQFALLGSSPAGPFVGSVSDVNWPSVAGTGASGVPGTNSLSYQSFLEPVSADGKLLLLGTAGHLYKSVNAGSTWTQPSTEFSADELVAAFLNPQNLSLGYAATASRGVLKTTNGGATWLAASSGLGTTKLCSMAVDASNPSVLYAGSSSADPRGIYRSTDAANSWQAVNRGLESRSVCRIVIDPVQSKTIYALTDAGTYKSLDRGDSWTALVNPVYSNGVEAEALNDLAIDPQVNSIVYAGSGAIWRSIDGGQSWLEMPTQNPAFPDGATRIAVDPSQASRLVILSSQAGMQTYEIAPDLELKLAASSGSASVDAPQSVELSVVNNGALAATRLRVSGTIPAGSSQASTAKIDHGNCTLTGALLDCAVDSIGPGETLELQLQFTLSRNVSASLDLLASAHEGDPATANNRVQARYFGQAHADLGVDVSAASAAVVGDVLSFTLTAANNGPDSASDVLISLDLPVGLQWQSSAGQASVCEQSGPVVGCRIASMASAQQEVIRVAATAVAEGHYQIAGSINGADSIDDIATNDSSIRTLAIGSGTTTPPPPTSTEPTSPGSPPPPATAPADPAAPPTTSDPSTPAKPSGSSGGGSFGRCLVAVFALAALWRRRNRAMGQDRRP